MNAENQPKQENSKGLDIFLVLVCVVIAWPALLVSVVVRWQIKRQCTDPSPYWIAAAAIGACGALLLVTRENPYPFLLRAASDITPLLLQMDSGTLTRFVRDLLPVWERSVLVFPWLMLVLELFSPKNLQATLLAQERRRRAIQTSKSTHAARRIRKAPDQINGKGVLGALIDNPNE
jgi:hypothetical protein